jgi:aminoglycoside 3-N-acetyltransferase
MNVKHYKVSVNNGLLKKLFSIIPYLEIFFRISYWMSRIFLPSRIIFYINKYREGLGYKKNKIYIELDELMNFLENIGIKKGTTLIVHSSYDALSVTRKLPKDIVNELVNLVGSTGNVIMPANRIFDYSINPVVFDVKRNRIWTGALPFALFLNKNSIKSKFPINSIVSIGPDSESFVCDELNEEDTPPCGRNSAWYKLYLKNATIISLGVDLTHSLTMTHLVEDCWFDEWPISEWYDKVSYNIYEEKSNKLFRILQRKSYIGKFFYAESKLASDLERENILSAYNYKGIKIQILNSINLVEFLKSKRPSSYPFYGLKTYKILKWF